MNGQIPDKGETSKEEVVEYAADAISETGDVDDILHQQREDGESLLHGSPKLSIEEIERVMTKVQDIDAAGVAYTQVLSRGKVRETGSRRIVTWQEIASRCAPILEHGIYMLFGKEPEYILSGKEPESKHLKKLANDNSQRICFNIVRRACDLTIDESRRESLPLEIARSNYVRCDDFVVSIIFDLSEYREIEPRSHTYRGIFDDVEIGQYYSAEPELFQIHQVLKEWYQRLPSHPDREQFFKYALRRSDRQVNMRFDNQGRPMPDSMHGFELQGILPTNNFQGIVLSTPINSASIQEFINVMYQCYKNKKEMFLPVYDTKGNLLWPKKMNYEQVKEFVVQRDTESDEG